MDSVRRLKCTDRSVVTPAVIAISLLLGPSPARAQSTPVTTCGQVLSAPGQYHLTGDLGPCTGDGVVIAANDVHFSLAGFTISGEGCAGGVGVSVGFQGSSVFGASRVHVEGGAVTGFIDGIALNTVTDSRVNGMTVFGACFFGIAVGNSSEVRLDTNVVTTSGIDGVAIGASHDILVHSNDISRNARAGVDISNFADNNTIVSNILNENGGDGIAIFNGNNNTLRENAANRNNSGIRLSASGNSGNRAVRNTTNGNSNVGIFIIAGGTENVARRNTAMGNGIFDLSDANPGCDANTWRANVFMTDQVNGSSDGGPGVGCIR